MTALPGRCVRCLRPATGHGGVHLSDVVDFRASDNILKGGCSHCGGDVQLLEGRLNVVDGAFEMLSGPDWSWEVVEQLKLRLRRAAQEGNADAVRDVDPTFANTLERATRDWPKLSRRDLFFALYLALDTDYGNWGENLGAVKAAALALIRFAVETGHPPPIL